jgi:hypothetical protein
MCIKGWFKPILTLFLTLSLNKLKSLTCGFFENRVLRRIFGPKRDEVKGSGENYIMRSFMSCTHHPILCG